MAYCVDADVKRYCTPAQDVTTTEAIAHAQNQIEMITHDYFEPHNGMVVDSYTNKAGVAYLPATTRAITSVTDKYTGIAIPETTYRITLGKLGCIRVTPYRQYNILVVGLEPWRQGRWQTGNIWVTVEADLGHATTPDAIRLATAMLAASYMINTALATPTASGQILVARPDNVASITVEGFATTLTAPPSEPLTSEIRGTGFGVIDRLLTPYRRQPRTRWS